MPDMADYSSAPDIDPSAEQDYEVKLEKRPGPMTDNPFDSWLADPQRRTLVMGILNITPDSFSDGGAYAAPDAAVEAALEMAKAGADLIDIGGESTRPGAQRIGAAAQIERVLPVIQRLAGRVDAVLSIDTTRADVARAALDAGVTLINDISGGTDDPAMLPLAAQRDAPIVLMHMQGKPATMQVDPQYADVVTEVKQYLKDRLEAAMEAGVKREKVLLDPGIGFGKTADHNLALLRELRQFTELGRPLLLGTSRKGFVGRITGETEASQRLMGTAATVAWCATNGAAIVRVHDVAAMVKVVRMIGAMQRGRLVE
jgi:dihydropteroate synthase